MERFAHKARERNPLPFAVPPKILALQGGLTRLGGSESQGAFSRDEEAGQSTPFDADVRQMAVQAFIDLLLAGVGLRLEVAFCEPLAVEALLDTNLSTLTLIFNSIKKTLPLVLVREVNVDRSKAEVCSARDARPGPFKDAVDEASQKEAFCKPAFSIRGGAWHARLDLEDDRCCTFVFDATDAGHSEAVYFGNCLRVLAEAARFEAVRTDLTKIGQGDIPRIPTIVAAAKALNDWEAPILSATGSFEAGFTEEKETGRGIENDADGNMPGTAGKAGATPFTKPPLEDGKTANGDL